MDRLSGEKIDFMKFSMGIIDRENTKSSVKYALGSAALMGGLLFLMTRYMNRRERRKFLAQMDRDMRRARRPNNTMDN